MAKDMLYRWEKTQEIQQQFAAGQTPDIYDDILSGAAYLDLVDSGEVGKYDTVLMLSIDGAQPYESKKSDCWIYIWILVNLAPNRRYKIRNILLGGIIPGPESPGDLDSFLFPGLAHLSALQKEGLQICNSHDQEQAVAFLFLLLVLADAVVMAHVSGSVGHHGRKGCRLLCGFPGRNKVQGSHYYPALLRSISFDDHQTSSHSDVDINTLPIPNKEAYRADLSFVVASQNRTAYEKCCLNTSIGKPSIIMKIPENYLCRLALQGT
jgi:hypothetical protein